MGKLIHFDESSHAKLTLKNSDDEFVATIEIALTIDDSGPIIHISCDEEEIFENPNSFQLSFMELLRGIAEEWLDGFYCRKGKNQPVRSYRHLASILRHYANLMDLRAEDNKDCNEL